MSQQCTAAPSLARSGEVSGSFAWAGTYTVTEPPKQRTRFAKKDWCPYEKDIATAWRNGDTIEDIRQMLFNKYSLKTSLSQLKKHISRSLPVRKVKFSKECAERILRLITEDQPNGRYREKISLIAAEFHQQAGVDLPKFEKAIRRRIKDIRSKQAGTLAKGAQQASLQAEAQGGSEALEPDRLNTSGYSADGSRGFSQRASTGSQGFESRNSLELEIDRVRAVASTPPAPSRSRSALNTGLDLHIESDGLHPPFHNGADPKVLGGSDPQRQAPVYKLPRVIRSEPIKNTGMSEVHELAESGNTKMIKVLAKYIDNREMFRAMTHQQRTALHLAIENGHLETASALIDIERGIIRREGWEVDSDGWSPLHIAARHGNKDLFDFLLASAESLGNRDPGDIFDLLFPSRKIPVAASPHVTALHVAIAYGHERLCRPPASLLNIFLPIIRQDSGWTLLHEAARSDNFRAAKILLDAGANIDAVADVDFGDSSASTPHGQVKAMTPLNISMSPLFRPGVGRATGSAEILIPPIVELLLQRGATINQPFSDGGSLLHIITKFDLPKALKLFLEHDSTNLNLQDDLGQTPLHIASFYGAVECSELLLSYGADGTILDSRGNPASIFPIWVWPTEEAISMVPRAHNVDISNSDAASILATKSPTQLRSGDAEPEMTPTVFGEQQSSQGCLNLSSNKIVGISQENQPQLRNPAGPSIDKSSAAPDLGRPPRAIAQRPSLSTSSNPSNPSNPSKSLLKPSNAHASPSSQSSLDRVIANSKPLFKLKCERCRRHRKMCTYDGEFIQDRGTILGPCDRCSRKKRVCVPEKGACLGLFGGKVSGNRSNFPVFMPY